MAPDIYMLPVADSTNAVLRAMVREGKAEAGSVVAAREQTAGRGQRGNSWESEPGCNLTFSMLIKPRMLRADMQFALSEAVALGVAESVQNYVSAPVEVKWPNDIYVGDRKICGILIENSLSGNFVSSSIAGVGINVNQTVFRSDAPNPVSVFMLTGQRTDLGAMLRDVTRSIARYCDLLDNACYAELHGKYMERLWRREGLHPYRHPGGEAFYAVVAGIAPTGHLTLRRADGSEHTYAFKEVEAIVPHHGRSEAYRPG